MVTRPTHTRMRCPNGYKRSRPEKRRIEDGETRIAVREHRLLDAEGNGNEEHRLTIELRTLGDDPPRGGAAAQPANRVDIGIILQPAADEATNQLARSQPAPSLAGAGGRVELKVGEP